MKIIKSKYLIFSILIFLYFPIFAQENIFSDIDKYFSKKEKTTFENALEYQNAFYKKILPDSVIDFSKIKVSVITDNRMYELRSLVRKNSPGFYSSFDHRLIIFKVEKTKNAFMETIFHELSHALLHLYSDTIFFDIPSWLNEGLADYLEGMTYNSKKIVHKENTHWIARVKTLIELRDFDFVEFVDWDYKKFSKESFSQEGYGYAVAYCMVLFLIKKDENTAYSLFRSLIEEQKPTTEIFDKYYGGGFAQFEKDFIKKYSE